MCYITATELKNNLNKYMVLSENEDVYVTKNGKVITLLTNPKKKALEDFLSLEGILAGDNSGKDTKQLIGECILEHENTRGH